MANQNMNKVDYFIPLKCYEGFKHAFLCIRSFNPKKENIEDYSEYLLDSLELCLKKVKFSSLFI